MKFKLLALAALVAVSGSALAESAPYAKVASVNGLVTVSAKNQMTNVKAGMALAQGSQVLASSTGAANIVFANGCAVFLKPGQAMSVSESECSAINAQCTSVGVASSAATGGFGEAAAGLGLTTAQIAILAAVGVGAVYTITKDDDNNTVITATNPTTPGTTPVTVTVPAPPPAISGS